MGLDPKQVHDVFLTHHHFDHNVDLPCFILSRWDQSIGDEPPLKVFGPEPTEAFVERLIGEDGAYTPDWQSRIEHPASHACHTARGGALPRPPPRVEAQDIGDGDTVSVGPWTVHAAQVHHVEPTLVSLAYRFELDCSEKKTADNADDTDEGAVVFAGDCGDCAALRELAKGADTLVVACTHFGSPPSNSALTDVITGTPEVVSIANEAGVKRVVLTHFSPNFRRPGEKERALAAVARGYSGKIHLGEELQAIEL